MRYNSTKKMRHANDLAKLNKLPWGWLNNMTPHDTYSITIHVRTLTLAEISHEQKW